MVFRATSSGTCRFNNFVSSFIATDGKVAQCLSQLENMLLDGVGILSNTSFPQGDVWSVLPTQAVEDEPEDGIESLDELADIDTASTTAVSLGDTVDNAVDYAGVAPYKPSNGFKLALATPVAVSNQHLKNRRIALKLPDASWEVGTFRKVYRGNVESKKGTSVNKDYHAKLNISEYGPNKHWVIVQKS